MYVSCPRLGQTDRNRLQIGRRSLLLAPQTVQDRTDEAYIVPPAGLTALGVCVALLSVTTTNRSAHKYVAPPRGGRDGSQHKDRKSTRLNSSHQIISYAVFCLKKKKKKEIK